MFDGNCKRVRNLKWRPIAKRCRKLRCGFADQIGLGNSREEPGQRGNPASFRHTTCNPVDVLREGGQRRSRCFRIGCLGIVDEQDFPAMPNLLHAVGQTGKALQSRIDFFKA